MEGEQHDELCREPKTATALTDEHAALGAAIQPETLNCPEDFRYKPHWGHDRRAAPTESSQSWLKDPSNSGTPEVCGSEDACRP